jgi:hypothetical protein
MDFTLSNLMHSALVSISGDVDESYVHVQLLQSFFKKVFGVEHIRFRNHHGELHLEEAKYPFVRQIAAVVSARVNKELENHFPSTRLRAI